jgi:hypothetical protein
MALVIVGPRVGWTLRKGWMAGVRKSPLLLQPRPSIGLRFVSVPWTSRHRSSRSVDPSEPALTTTTRAVALPAVNAPLAIRS